MHKFLFLLLLNLTFAINLLSNGLLASYYDKINLPQDQLKYEKIDQQIYFEWTNQKCAPDGLGSYDWSAQWNGYVYIPENYELYINQGTISVDTYIDDAHKTFLDVVGTTKVTNKNEIPPGIHKIKITQNVGIPACTDRQTKLLWSNTGSKPSATISNAVPSQNLGVFAAYFGSQSYIIQEPKTGTTTLELPVKIDANDILPINYPVTLELAFTDETAKENVNYSISSKIVTMKSASDQKVILTIKNDGVATKDAKFKVAITKAYYTDKSGKNLGIIEGVVGKAATITIIDGTDLGICYATDISTTPREQGWEILSTPNSNNMGLGNFVTHLDSWDGIFNMDVSYYGNYTRDIVWDLNKVFGSDFGILGNGILPSGVSQRNRLTIGRDIRLQSTAGRDPIFGARNNSMLAPAQNNLIRIEFDYYSYGGCALATDTYLDNQFGGAGMAVILYDANTQNIHTGGSGGSLGYTRTTNLTESNLIEPAFSGGWLGIGLDQSGHFANRGYGKNESLSGIYGGSELSTEFSKFTNTITIRGDVKNPSSNDSHRFIARSWQLARDYSGYEPTRLAGEYNHYLKNTDSFHMYSSPLGQAHENWQTSTATPQSQDYYAGKFIITIDNTQIGKSLVKVERKRAGENKFEIVKFHDKDGSLVDSIDILNGYGQGIMPENLGVAFTSSNTFNTCNVHQISNVKMTAQTCLAKASTNNIRVVERQFAEAHAKNPTKYDIDWLLNSPLRTKIAGGATLLAHDSNVNNIGYEYCVVTKDAKAKVFVAANLMNPDGKTYRDFNLTTPTYDNITGAKTKIASEFVNTTSDEMTLEVDPNNPINACFVLKSNFTQNNPTQEFRFLVGYKDSISKPIADTNLNNSFAIRPAGFYMQFNEIDENGNTIKEQKPTPYDFTTSQLTSKTTAANNDDSMLMPINQIARQKADGKLYGEYSPLNLYVDLNSTSILKTETHYKVNLEPTVLNITSKNGSNENTVYRYNWIPLGIYTKTISYEIDSTKNVLNNSFSYGIMNAENNQSCNKVDNIPLGKFNSNKYILPFNNGNLKFDSSIDDTVSQFTKNDATDYLIYHGDNIMSFRNDIVDSAFALKDYIKIAQYNGVKFDGVTDLTADDKVNLEKEIKNYGYRCKGYNISSISPNTEFDDELIPCNIEVVNPKYTKFMPSIFDVYFMHVINANEISKNPLENGFTFMNDIFHGDKNLASENNMSAKLQLIVAPVNSKGEIFSNFNNKCYASDLNIKLDYIGDRNIRYKLDTLATISTDERSKLYDSYNKIFNDNFKNENTTYKYFYTTAFNPYNEFDKYLQDKKTYMSDELQANIKKETTTGYENNFYTKKITFNIDNFYTNDKPKGTNSFCPTQTVIDPTTNLSTTKYLCDDIAISSEYPLVSDDYNFDFKNNYNEYRQTYKKNMFRRSGNENFEFASADNFDEQYFRFKIGRDFFNQSMKYFDKDKQISSTFAPLGSAPIFVSFNFDKNANNPSNPIAAFTRDFIVTDINLTKSENNTTISYLGAEKINLKYIPNDKTNKALFYDTIAYAPDYTGPTSGYNAEIYFATYCDTNLTSVCSKFNLNTDPVGSVGMLKSSWKNISSIINNQTTPTDMKIAIGQKDNITYTNKDKETKIDEVDDKINKSTIESDVLKFSSTHTPLPFTDTVTINSPSYLMRMSETLKTPLNNFNVTFESISKSNWFGEGGVGNEPDKSNVGKVLGADDNDNSKFKKENNPTKRSNRINW